MGNGFAQQLGRLANDTGDLPGCVDRGVPLTSAQGSEVAVSVAVELLDVREQVRIGLAACERRDLMALRERRIDDRAPQELRPAEDQ